MIGYNNQGITLLPYNAPILLYDKNMHYTKPPEVDRAWSSMAQLQIEARDILARLVFTNEKAWGNRQLIGHFVCCPSVKCLVLP